MSDPAENPLVSYVLATYNRADDLAEAVESVLRQSYRPIEVVVISNSTDETSELFEAGGRFDVDEVAYYHFPDRCGPAEARNRGFERSSGEIIVTIDDDAVLPDADATSRIVSDFRENPDVGVVAFRSEDYETRETIRMEIPDPPEFGTSPSERYRTTSFIGVGTAIRRAALNAAGPFPENFEYGFEEMDLSLRIADAGYDILYDPSVVVRHKNSPEGRRDPVAEYEYQIENRIRLAVRNLPVQYVVGTTLIWTAYWLLRSGFRIESIRRIFRRLYEDRDDLSENRNVVDDDTIRRLKARSSMLYGWWYGPHPRRILGPDGDLRRLFW